MPRGRPRGMNYTPDPRDRNNRSLETAEHYRQPWCQYEDELLLEGFGHEPIALIAEALGRTVDACHDRYYRLTSGAAASRADRQHTSVRYTRTTTTTTTETRYVGAGDCDEDRWWDPSYYQN